MQTKFASNIEGIGELVAIFEGDVEHRVEKRFKRVGPFGRVVGLTAKQGEVTQFVDERREVANKLNRASADVVVANNARKRFSRLWRLHKDAVNQTIDCDAPGARFDAGWIVPRGCRAIGVVDSPVDL